VLSPDAELQELAKASFERGLTREEQARVQALSFQASAELETARLVRERHPDVYPMLLGQLRDRLEGVNTPTHRQESYESRRQAAIDAGRAVPEPNAQAIAQVDRMAGEVRETRRDPWATLDSDHRDAFRAAIAAGDFGGMVRAWSDWLAARVRANAEASRKAAAETWLGRATSADHRMELNWTDEFENAVGGRTVADDRPVVQR
jgi:hypothetical protein